MNNIKILTYNFFQRPIFLKNNNSDYKDSRVELFKNEIKNFDIICFQELFGSFNKRKNKVLEIARDEGFKYFAHNKNPNILSDYLIDSGLVIISKYPIIESEFHCFPFGVSADGLSSKGVLFVKIQIENQLINIFNTHTQASYESSDLEVFNKFLCCRYIQIFDSCKFIKNKIINFKNTELIIYLGDFNINSLQKPFNLESYDNIQDKIIKYDKTIWENSIKNGKINEYDLIFNSLKSFFGNKIIDVMFEENKKHLVTFGNTYFDEFGIEMPKETDLTSSCSNKNKECLDYIFILNQSNEGFKYKKKSFKIEEFRINRNEPPYQLSDHYGLSIIIN